MAIVDRWDIWYLNAGMSLSAEQAPRRGKIHAHVRWRFCAAAIGLRCRQSPSGSVSTISSVDCAETRGGSLLVFEADNTAIVHDMDPAELFPYKQPQMRKIFDAFAAMLERRATQPGACRMNIVLRAAITASESGQTLDPQNWDELRALGHRMLDDMLDYAASIRDRPVWSPIPQHVRARFRAELPRQPSGLDEVYREFTDFIVPYATGNVHPGFMGWVHGGGTAVGMLAEMLAAGLNANLGGRDHIPIEVERQVVEWMRAMFGLPHEASGIFVTGTSMANLMAVLVARTAALGQSRSAARHRRSGRVADGVHLDCGSRLHRQGDGSRRLRQRCTAHASRSIDCIASTWRHCVPGSPADRRAGRRPFLVVGFGRYRGHRCDR